VLHISLSGSLKVGKNILHAQGIVPVVEGVEKWLKGHWLCPRQGARRQGDPFFQIQNIAGAGNEEEGGDGPAHMADIKIFVFEYGASSGCTKW
jgi:hypothetical protein